MLKNARLTVARSDDPECAQEAERQIHQTMYRFALGQITGQERERILSLLRPCCPGIFFRPRAVDDKHAASAAPCDEVHVVRGVFAR
jgi:hypothetical protein